MDSIRRLLPGAILIAAALVVGCSPAAGGPHPVGAPDYGDAFWGHWGDGRAEIATYDLTIPRYGELRSGSAVAIFVTEPFAAGARVKSDRGGGADVFQALKLNLVKDFATGVYDYNTMLSAFVATESKAGMTAGEPAKLSFSSQEWCGQVYEQVLFDADVVRDTAHSYFEGEADRERTLPRPGGGLAEDTLYLWARGLAAPSLEPGETQQLSLLRSLQRVRMEHLPLVWQEATLSREGGSTTTTVPAGSFEVDTFRARIEGGPEWIFHVERAAPRRLVRWRLSTGEQAELVATERLPYWQLHGNRDLDRLDGIGLVPRPPRTP